MIQYMAMNKSTCVAAIAALSVGFVIGWSVKPAPIASDARDGNVRTRRSSRIEDSKATVKTMTEVVTNVVYNTVTNTVASENRPRGPGGFMDHLEKMKTDDPQRYITMTNRMARFRKRMLDRAVGKLETLESIDTTGWSKKQVETHEKYQELISRREELLDMLSLDSGISNAERMEVMGELRTLGQELLEVGRKERNTLLDKTFIELGYSDSDAKEIRETVKKIYSTTEEWGGFGHRDGRRRAR